MATQHAKTMLLVFFLLITSSSYARPLNLNLALPSDRVVVVAPPKEPAAGHVAPCGHMTVAGKPPFPGTRLGGRRYGSLVLNMLPKGPVPPSGPSKGTNNLNN